MKRFKLSALVITVALLVAVVGSAALSQITFDRSLSGSVYADMDPNAAIVFAANNGYSSVVTQQDGIVSINLAQAINNDTALGFNTQALFNIGTAAAPVFNVTNNSDVEITLNLNTTTAGLSMSPAAGDYTIAAGTSKDFYFTFDTTGIVPGSPEATITGKIEVR